MKARTHIWNDENHCEIFFCYEDYGGEKFRSYDDAKKKGWKPIYLIGYLKSHYWGGSEPIDELHLSRRPKIGEVKKFIEHCKKVIMED